ncbi:MAG: bifunctional oligoribonuclease/PAP phosphatase NrnA [Candidatus Omnitrophota bacterium]
MSINKIVRLIEENRSFLISSHIAPEGDALGSELALAYLLRAKNKNVVIVNERRIPREYEFFPGREILYSLRGRPRGKSPDVVFILDCSELRRCGKVADIVPQDRPLAVIDHHITNCHFGDINWVDAGASSAGEMVYRLYKRMKVPFSRDSAMCLYVSMLTDTGSFRYSNTTAYTHRAVAELLGFGISVNKVYQRIYESRSYADVLSLKQALQTMHINKRAGLAWFKMEMRKGEHTEHADSILDFARRIKDVQVCFLLRYERDKGEVRVNMRSRGRVDVSKVALRLGGGGHKNAAGATLKGLSLDEAEKKVLRLLR